MTLCKLLAFSCEDIMSFSCCSAGFLPKVRGLSQGKVKFSKGAGSIAGRVLAVMTSVNVSSYILSQRAHFRSFHHVIILYIKSSDDH